MEVMAPAVQDVTAMLRLWTTAEYRGNTDVLAELLADDFTGVNAHGRMLGKRQWLARHQDGHLFHTTFTLNDTSIRVYGDTAVIVAGHNCAGHDQGQTFGHRCRLTGVAVRDAGQWRLKAVHLSKQAQDDAAA
jgi:uncharacterized protein (TIGR02246 family)